MRVELGQLLRRADVHPSSGVVLAADLAGPNIVEHPRKERLLRSGRDVRKEPRLEYADAAVVEQAARLEPDQAMLHRHVAAQVVRWVVGQYEMRHAGLLMAAHGCDHRDHLGV